MSMPPAAMAELARYSERRDRTGYYEALLRYGDPYGRLALSVCKQSLMAGRVAKSYAEAVGRIWRRPISDAQWLQISEGLMRADFAARGIPTNFVSGTPELTWETIRNYHVNVFASQSQLPGLVWTAWIPLFLDGPAKGQKLWRRLVTEDFLTVATQTCWLTLGAVVHAKSPDEYTTACVKQVLNQPPIVTDTPSQSCQDLFSSLKDETVNLRQSYAISYLAVLASIRGELIWRLAGIAPTSAWRSLEATLNSALAQPDSNLPATWWPATP